jgi:peptidoglycan/LPS O-acetylase OafA/YrhL
MLPSMNTLPAFTPARFDYLDGLRGVASVQVLLLHYCAFFLPGFARINDVFHFVAEERLRDSWAHFIIAGNLAVAIFFTMSGFVLTSAVLQIKIPFWANILKRLVRLGIPVATSILLATLLILLFPDSKNLAASVTGSIWASALIETQVSFFQTMKEALLNSMVIGYRGLSIFSLIPSGNSLLTPITESPNSPTWTLHLEFWGSVVVVAVAQAYRSMNRWFFWTFFSCASLVLANSFYVLFLVGFFLCLHRDKFLKFQGKSISLTGGLLVALAIAASSENLASPNSVLYQALTHASVGIPSENTLAIICSTLLFIGVLITPQLRNLLSAKPALWLGKISFCLYLIHFPILFTVTAEIFIKLSEITSYLAAAVVSSIVGILLSLVFGKIIERWIDRPAVRLSKVIVNKFFARRITGQAPCPTMLP